MKVEIGIRPNCSEWDEAVESDYIEDLPVPDESLYPDLENEIKKEAVKIGDWD